MSFPNRTAYYDNEEDELMVPEDVRHEIEHGLISPIFKMPTGILSVSRPPEEPNTMEQTDRYIPLASTGLKDSQGQEIFEGHLMEWHEPGERRCSEGIVVVKWNKSDCCFCLGSYMNMGSLSHYECIDSLWRIKGHSLIDTDLVPDSFDVNQYYEVKIE